MTEQNKSARVKISGLWVSETKGGQKYMSGSNGSQRWTIWPNGYFEEGSNQPTHILYVEQQQKKEEGKEEKF